MGTSLALGARGSPDRGRSAFTLLTSCPFDADLPPAGSVCVQDSDGPPRPEGAHPPVFPALRHSRVVSSTSEEEEALTEKFLKINCKYITDGKVSHRHFLSTGVRTKNEMHLKWRRMGCTLKGSSQVMGSFVKVLCI